MSTSTSICMNPEDKDPIETSEWLDAINSVIEEEGLDLSLIHI